MAVSRVYSVSLLDSVDFNPDSTAAEVLQNVRTIISTRRGTVPLDRDFGLSWTYIDKPLPLAKMYLKAEIINAVQVYEPRAAVTDVEFDDSQTDAMDGILNPIVKVRLDTSVLASSDSSSTSSGSSSSTAETISTSTDSSSDTSEQTTALLSQVSDLTARLEDIEQSDYSQLYQNGES